jgi:hypothetical protein
MNLATDQRRDADAPRTTPPPSCCLGWHQTDTRGSVHRKNEMDQQGWNERTRQLLEKPYLQARRGPAGSGCGHDEAGWELLGGRPATEPDRGGGENNRDTDDHDRQQGPAGRRSRPQVERQQLPPGRQVHHVIGDGRGR